METKEENFPDPPRHYGQVSFSQRVNYDGRVVEIKATSSSNILVLETK